jgi:hypothetical protein
LSGHSRFVYYLRRSSRISLFRHAGVVGDADERLALRLVQIVQQVHDLGGGVGV